MSKLSRAIKFIMAIWLVAFCLAIPQAIQFGLVPMYGGRLCTVNLNLYCVFRLLWFGRELRTSYGVCYADGIDIIWFENKWGKYLYVHGWLVKCEDRECIRFWQTVWGRLHVGITSLQDIYATHIFSVKLSGQDPDRAHVGDSRHFYWNWRAILWPHGHTWLTTV